ncbi:hypothetical protein Ahy_B06g084604 isoform A [Arachis hypogaea]|uniref:PB1-like domain-containing protein n=1 Tax=Arachis hypogaea TaxID=3818 RepID=A0A444YSE2_ARAHY|nr:hypothetical protein Ahy_B06g084604 isoform A [Arachis hypogaea]
MMMMKKKKKKKLQDLDRVVDNILPHLKEGMIGSLIFKEKEEEEEEEEEEKETEKEKARDLKNGYNNLSKSLKWSPKFVPGTNVAPQFSIALNIPSILSFGLHSDPSTQFRHESTSGALTWCCHFHLGRRNEEERHRIVMQRFFMYYVRAGFSLLCVFNMDEVLNIMFHYGGTFEKGVDGKMGYYPDNKSCLGDLEVDRLDVFYLRNYFKELSYHRMKEVWWLVLGKSIKVSSLELLQGKEVMIYVDDQVRDLGEQTKKNAKSVPHHCANPNLPSEQEVKASIMVPNE